MNTGSYVFVQMVKFLDKSVFLRIMKKYDGDKYVNWTGPDGPTLF